MHWALDVEPHEYEHPLQPVQLQCTCLLTTLTACTAAEQSLLLSGLAAVPQLGHAPWHGSSFMSAAG